MTGRDTGPPAGTDALTAEVAEFAAGLRGADLPPAVLDAARDRLLDTVGCALGGYHGEPVAVARRLAGRAAPGSGVPGWQLGRPAPDLPPDLAAFLNTAAIRYLDLNDWYPGGHPSDCLGAHLALAGAPGVTGQRLLTAMVVSYEVFIRLTRASGLRRRGWDQGFAQGVATAAGLGNQLGLDARQIAAAVGIMATAGLPTRATRTGQLSMWKGCATAYATRNATFATLLAAGGMTGPPAGFEGRNGLWELVTGAFRLPPFGTGEEQLLTPRTSLKYWPVCYHLQAAAWAGLALRAQVSPAELAAVEVDTYWETWRDTGSEPDKWDPATRETADHSLPYVLARTLVDGALDQRAFAPAGYRDPALRPLMSRIRVRVDDRIEAEFPDRVVLRLTARTGAGATVPVEVVNPAGHADNPLTGAQLREKFDALAAPMLGGAGDAAAARQAWWELAGQPDPAGAMARTVVAGEPGPAEGPGDLW